MPPKRKPDVSEAVPASKKQRTSHVFFTEDQLQSAPREDLIAKILDLQHRIQERDDELQKLKALAPTTANRGAANVESVWTDEKITERANKTRDICAKEIKKQMKWQPSCKQGTTRWSYTGVVPNVEVFNEVFGVKKGDKAWKMKKISRAEFAEMFGRISASCRYNDLNITGSEVSVRWNPEEQTFKLAGTYGIGF